mmetsp:Transcript_10922/g.32736  ORF Transcript_10922/g.32736 Transcript_10922/m.32736 type:complete len:85 (+) Transcript_10922:146-400(+)
MEQMNEQEQAALGMTSGAVTLWATKLDTGERACSGTSNGQPNSALSLTNLVLNFPNPLLQMTRGFGISQSLILCTVAVVSIAAI